MNGLPDTRTQADLAGANKYDTGKLCRNGHCAARYTQSGVCAECLRASQRTAQARHKRGAPERAARKQFALHVCQLAERVPAAQVELLGTIAEALMHCRFPALVDVVDLRGDQRPSRPYAGTVRATFLVHDGDRAALHALCVDAMRAAGLDPVAVGRAAGDYT